MLDFHVSADEYFTVYQSGDELQVALSRFSSCASVDELRDRKKRLEVQLQGAREDLLAYIEDATPKVRESTV